MSEPTELVKVLMNRDGMTQADAEQRVDEVRELFADADPWEADDIIMDELGLEMDYIFDIL